MTYQATGAPLVAHLSGTAGAFPRDPFDARVLGHVAAGTFDPAPIETNPAGDTLTPPFTSPPPTPPDADRDGMPDAWEAAHRLDPSDPSDRNGTTLSASSLGAPGYTNLEVYLHERSVEVLGG